MTYLDQKTYETYLDLCQIHETYLDQKTKLKEFETIALYEKLSAVLQRKLPPKLKDPGLFIIPCSIRLHVSSKIFCDPGASINLMPVSIYKRLGLTEVKPTFVKFKFVNGSYIFPKRENKNISVKVDKIIYFSSKLCCIKPGKILKVNGSSQAILSLQPDTSAPIRVPNNYLKGSNSNPIHTKERES